MSRLSEMIARLCPNGVEYRKLGEIATIERGNGLQKSDFKPSGIPCIHYGQLYTELQQYASAISNEGGGKIVFGITDKRPRKDLLN